MAHGNLRVKQLEARDTQRSEAFQNRGAREDHQVNGQVKEVEDQRAEDQVEHQVMAVMQPQGEGKVEDL